MNILTISKLKKEFSGELLFHNISFDINSKDKIAVIGKNGTGKSTLLKMIQGEIRADEGDIYINKQATIGYLSQDVISQKDNTLYQEMLDVFEDIMYLEQRIHDITNQMEEEPENAELIKAYSQIVHRYEVIGGYEYQTKIQMILSQFGFDESMFERQISSFSGGEKTRVAFAKLLLENPDLLILDEPTNHLDIEIIDWLEDYLTKYDGAVLIVTHDKYFISKVCRKMIEIDHHTSHVYHGTFDQYQEEKVKRYELLLKQYNRQQKEIAHLQSFIDRFRYNAKRASLAKDRQKKIDRIEKIEKPHLSKQRVHIQLTGKRPTREIILQAKELSIGYPNNTLLSNINFTMRGFDKLAIVGPNGTGKTTLLRVIDKTLSPLSGSIYFLRNYKIGYFDQNQESLHCDKTIFSEIHDYHPMYTNYDIRSVAAKFLFFGDDLDKPIHILSGGEKVRLVLLLMMLEEPDLLILDEPTNHLDIETKDIVEDVLSQFMGPIIFVSHDRYFINKIATKLVHLDAQEAIEFTGSYDAFKESRKPVKSEPKATLKRQEKPQTQSVQKQIKQTEHQIQLLEQEIHELRQETFIPEVYEDYNKIHALQDDIRHKEQTLHELEESYYNLLEAHERNEV
ncbi:ABC-F family ATP-binding cassette domain-containing protein [Candidatus Xianfuyuplasma coldseepsis]|uniref:ABC-F family ATP-binding cassette domain-containing protein n=1 Tax=Candidatus Xianfuyuplasma coldseepsis TaxID=2782163 RepID=A0A7L7KT18_9MOLU|nr:ABC-F family ATP-binding cassette domain-containing protein [Xianfuyuplasma coldseepsis]QMS85960.1 ABC-F family ATP-binding cassette domain-containing protein [Xianfuyuplasma coldseepsis]